MIEYNKNRKWLGTMDKEYLIKNEINTSLYLGNLPSAQSINRLQACNKPASDTQKDYVELKDIIMALPQIVSHQGEEEGYKILQQKLKEISENRKHLNVDEDKIEIIKFREYILPLIFESNLLKYIYEKPRGYPGDFLVQEMIWFGITRRDAYRYVGETECGKLLSAFSLNMENPLANVDRINYIHEKLRNSGKKIASIGCGSCIELWNLDNNVIECRDIFLLDQDNGALERTREKILCNKNDNIVFANDNILKFIVKQNHEKILRDRDFVYILGLLDYFSVRSSRKIIKSIWNSLAPGGTLIFSNAHPDNPTKFWLEYAGDWFLEYKNKDGMYDIVDGLEGVDTVILKLDKYNVYQYMEITKK